MAAFGVRRALAFSMPRTNREIMSSAPNIASVLPDKSIINKMGHRIVALHLRPVASQRSTLDLGSGVKGATQRAGLSGRHGRHGVLRFLEHGYRRERQGVAVAAAAATAAN